jgi:diguanylate cyclase (GGDEF)-like protein/PAS domain S-box-containing protein
MDDDLPVKDTRAQAPDAAARPDIGAAASRRAVRSRYDIGLIVTALAGLAFLLLIGYSHQSWRGLVDQHLGVTDQLETISRHVTLGHLWLEERLHGDATATDEEIQHNLDQARDLARRLRNSYPAPSALQPNSSPYRLAAGISELTEAIETLDSLTSERLARGGDALVGTNIDQLFDFRFRRALELIDRAVVEADTIMQMQLTHQLQLFVVILVLAVVIMAGASTTLHVHHRRQQAVAEALANSEQRYALATEGVNQGVWDWDIGSGQVYYSPRWNELLGLPAESHHGGPDLWFSRVHPDDVSGLTHAVHGYIDGRTTSLDLDCRIRHASGRYIWVNVRGKTARGEGDVIVRLVGSLTDIDERKQLESELSRLSLYDSVTGLANRALLMDRAKLALSRRRSHQGKPRAQVAMMVIDIDRFKFINESLGPSRGDQILTSIGARLEQSMRPEDTIARLSGDEFAVLMEWMEGAIEPEVIANRVRGDIQEPMQIGDQQVSLTAGIGIAIADEQDTADDLFRDAVAAADRAKSEGRGQQVIADHSLRAEVQAVARLEQDLAGALERREFRLHFQPIADLNSGRLAGFEALLRWEHPQRGLVSPPDFIYLAEETGLIVPIGHWVLQEVCRTATAWRRDLNGQEPPFIAVNVSARQFLEQDVHAAMEPLLNRHKREGHPLNLVIELTETTLLHHTSHVTAQLEALKNSGIRIALDDFGTGFSSLSYLHRFPIDKIKIDRSFVQRMCHASDCREIIQAIISMGHVMGMQITGEGIETAAQLSRLRELGCDYGQGYLFSRPVPPEKAIQFMLTDLFRVNNKLGG